MGSRRITGACLHPRNVYPLQGHGIPAGHRRKKRKHARGHREEPGPSQRHVILIEHKGKIRVNLCSRPS